MYVQRHTRVYVAPEKPGWAHFKTASTLGCFMSVTAVETAEDRADLLPDYPSFHREWLNRPFHSLFTDLHYRPPCGPTK